MIISNESSNKYNNTDKAIVSDKIRKVDKLFAFNNLIENSIEKDSKKVSAQIKENSPTMNLKKTTENIQNIKDGSISSTDLNNNLDSPIINSEIKNENSLSEAFKQAQESFKSILDNNTEEDKEPIKKQEENKLFVIKFKNFKSVEINIENIILKNKNIKREKNNITDNNKSITNNFILSKLNVNKPINKPFIANPIKSLESHKIVKESVISKNINKAINLESISKQDRSEPNSIQAINLENNSYKKSDDKIILLQMNKNEIKHRMEETISKIVEHKMKLPLTNIKIKLNNNEIIHLKFSGTKENASLGIKTSDKDVAKEISKVKETLASNIENNSNIKNLDVSIVLDKKETIEKYLYMINKDEKGKEKDRGQHNPPQKEVEVEEDND